MTSSTPMIGIRALAYHLPPHRSDIDSWAKKHRIPHERLARLQENGVAGYHDSLDRPTREMAADAIAQMLAMSGADPEEIDVLMFAHTSVNSVAPPPASITAYLQTRFGFHRANCFSVAQQNCVSTIAAIRLACMMIRTNQSIRNVVVVSSDQIRSDCDHLRAIQSEGMHSDGACALLISRDWSSNQILGVSYRAEARFFIGYLEEPEYIEGYYVSALAVLRQVEKRAGVKLKDLECILPHHINIKAWQKMTAFIRVPFERVFTENFGLKGHVFGCDAFINLADRGSGNGGDVLLYSNGLCGCYGAIVLRP